MRKCTNGYSAKLIKNNDCIAVESIKQIQHGMLLSIERRVETVENCATKINTHFKHSVMLITQYRFIGMTVPHRDMCRNQYVYYTRCYHPLLPSHPLHQEPLALVQGWLFYSWTRDIIHGEGDRYKVYNLQINVKRQYKRKHTLDCMPIAKGFSTAHPII